jgi:hypothetical protein
LRYFAVRGQPSAGACFQGGTSEISGTFNYALSNTYTFGGSASFSVGPFIEIGGGGEYSRGEERGFATAGTFSLENGQKGQIIIGRNFEQVDGQWEANVHEVDPGGAVFTTRRTIPGQNASLPVANSQAHIDVEKRGCNEGFQTPVGDVQFLG